MRVRPLHMRVHERLGSRKHNEIDSKYHEVSLTVDSGPETGFEARKWIRGPNEEQEESKRIGYQKVIKVKGNSRKHNEIDLRYDDVSLTVD